jgi:hypothetical protein
LFVIQPFNEDNDKQYKAIIKPTESTVGLISYHVDMDKTVEGS